MNCCTENRTSANMTGTAGSFYCKGERSVYLLGHWLIDRPASRDMVLRRATKETFHGDWLSFCTDASGPGCARSGATRVNILA